jgi:hypothetical protein
MIPFELNWWCSARVKQAWGTSVKRRALLGFNVPYSPEVLGAYS